MLDKFKVKLNLSLYNIPEIKTGQQNVDIKNIKKKIALLKSSQV